MNNTYVYYRFMTLMEQFLAKPTLIPEFQAPDLVLYAAMEHMGLVTEDSEKCREHPVGFPVPERQMTKDNQFLRVYNRFFELMTGKPSVRMMIQNEYEPVTYPVPHVTTRFTFATIREGLEALVVELQEKLKHINIMEKKMEHNSVFTDLILLEEFLNRYVRGESVAIRSLLMQASYDELFHYIYRILQDRNTDIQKQIDNRVSENRDLRDSTALLPILYMVDTYFGDHGGSVRSGWLTELGKRVYQIFEASRWKESYGRTTGLLGVTAT